MNFIYLFGDPDPPMDLAIAIPVITKEEIETLSLALIEDAFGENYDRLITKLRALADADYRTVLDRTCELFNAKAMNIIISPDGDEPLVPS